MTLEKKLVLPAFAALAFNALSCSTAPVAAQTVEVYRNSGLKQCADDKPAPEVFAKLLAENGIKVRSSACAHDGAMRAQMCGLDRGLLYVYEIDAGTLAKTLSLGFMDIKRIAANQGYRKLACEAA